jgi:peptidoglycan hydrolase-like protein with peptidoglycan-binding domain
LAGAFSQHSKRLISVCQKRREADLPRRAFVVKATITMLLIAAVPLLFRPLHPGRLKTAGAVAMPTGATVGTSDHIEVKSSPQTQAVTTTSSTPTEEPAQREMPATIRFGSTGSDVTAFQSRLAQRGWHLQVDGIDGPVTTGTLRAFQVEKQIPVDGIGGPSTWKALWDSPVTPGSAGAAPIDEFKATVKAAPVATTKPIASTKPAAVKVVYAANTLGGVWACIRQHESGGNYATNTGNGYYGAYQFALSTWRALGGAGLPSSASPAVQDAMAQKLQAQSGWGQWPVTSRMCGV